MTDLGSSEDSTWSVLTLNDDDTPMEFVVNAIEQFFDMDRERAIRLMLCIHSYALHSFALRLRPVDPPFAKFLRTFDQATLPVSLFIAVGCLSGQAVDRLRCEIREGEALAFR